MWTRNQNRRAFNSWAHLCEDSSSALYIVLRYILLSLENHCATSRLSRARGIPLRSAALPDLKRTGRARRWNRTAAVSSVACHQRIACFCGRYRRSARRALANPASQRRRVSGSAGGKWPSEKSPQSKGSQASSLAPHATRGGNSPASGSPAPRRSPLFRSYDAARVADCYGSRQRARRSPAAQTKITKKTYDGEHLARN